MVVVVVIVVQYKSQYLKMFIVCCDPFLMQYPVFIVYFKLLQTVEDEIVGELRSLTLDNVVLA